MGIDQLLPKRVKKLSGGERQAVSIAVCLGRDADLYLLDEPSAHLDANARMEAAKAIRRTMEANEKSAFVIDHDVYFIDIVSDSLLVFDKSLPREAYIEATLIAFWERAYNWSETFSKKIMQTIRIQLNSMENAIELWHEKGTIMDYFLQSHSVAAETSQFFPYALSMEESMNRSRTYQLIRVINTPLKIISKICSKWHAEEESLPRYSGRATGPYNLREGMNRFLAGVDVTFRRDHDSRRPRINKNESRKDREQRTSGDYYSYDA